MKRAALAGLALVAACSSLPAVDGGVVAIEVRTPASFTLAQGDTAQLLAVALDASGNQVATGIVWRTPDTALVALDSTSGLIVALSDSGHARVQAAAGTLASSLITVTLTPQPVDTTGGTGTVRHR